MVRRIQALILLLLCAAALCGSVRAQTGKTITIRMLDSRTGHLIATLDYLVRIDHLETLHANWVKQNEDGTGRLTLPPEATTLSVHATYASTTMFYIDCDTDKERGSSRSAAGVERWYSVADIVASGVVAPSYCGGKKVSDKMQVVANPGEFVFFVRKANAKEQFAD
jgi:hypothetical protein